MEKLSRLINRFKGPEEPNLNTIQANHLPPELKECIARLTADTKAPKSLYLPDTKLFVYRDQVGEHFFIQDKSLEGRSITKGLEISKDGEPIKISKNGLGQDLTAYILNAQKKESIQPVARFENVSIN